jgi:hypothetical protein
MIRIGLCLALGLVCLCGTDMMGLDKRDWMISASPLQGDEIFLPPHSQVIFRVADNHSI